MFLLYVLIFLNKIYQNICLQQSTYISINIKYQSKGRIIIIDLHFLLLLFYNIKLCKAKTAEIKTRIILKLELRESDVSPDEKFF